MRLLSGTLLASLAIGAVGCDAVLGIQDHATATPSEDAAASEDSGTSDSGPVIANDAGGADSAVGADGGGGGGDSGQDAAGPVDSGVDASNFVCLPGHLMCSGNTPEVCDGGAWQPSGPACGGTTPVCSNGACGTFRATGGIRSTAVTPLVDAGIFLVSGGFELGTRTCADGGMCVTGGIVP